MFQLATGDELVTHLELADGSPVPALANTRLRAATNLVLSTTAGARYDVRTDGLAADTATREALRDATCEHAAALVANNIDPRRGAAQAPRRVASKSLNGASVSYVADPASDTYLSDLASGEHLVYSAWLILRNAGLISNRVNTGGRVERFNVSQRYYDPLTGTLET